MLSFLWVDKRATQMMQEPFVKLIRDLRKRLIHGAVRCRASSSHPMGAWLRGTVVVTGQNVGFGFSSAELRHKASQIIR